MDILDNGFEDAMSVMLLPKEMRRPLRTSNMVERLNGELKRRANVIKVFPNPDSITRLMGAVTIDYIEMLASKSRMFYRTSMAKISEQTKLKLVILAHDQAQRTKAA